MSMPVSYWRSMALKVSWRSSLFPTVLQAEKNSSHGADWPVTCWTSDDYQLAVPPHGGVWGERTFWYLLRKFLIPS